MVWLIIIVVLVIILYIYYKRNKRFTFDSIVMINGAVGGCKSLTTFAIASFAIKKAHGIWYRRTHWYSKIFRFLKDEEEPFIYSNIPYYKNRKKGILHPLYKPLTNDILSRITRPNFKSVIVIDESSLLATSIDYKDKELSENLTLWLKLIRHELHGSYRNIWGSYPNIIINTQSKNDNHYAFDRTLNQVLYITKNYNLPFFKLVFCRDLLLIDSVENEFKDDYKEDLSTRWFLISKRTFNKYNSFAYSFLSDDFPIDNKSVLKTRKRFEIPTFHRWREIDKSNKVLYDKLKEKEKKESEVLKNGQ